jgi:hypothetical protein
VFEFKSRFRDISPVPGFKFSDTVNPQAPPRARVLGDEFFERWHGHELQLILSLGCWIIVFRLTASHSSRTTLKTLWVKKSLQYQQPGLLHTFT